MAGVLALTLAPVDARVAERETAPAPASAPRDDADEPDATTAESPPPAPAPAPRVASPPAPVPARTLRPLLRAHFDDGTGPWPAGMAEYRRGGVRLSAEELSIVPLFAQLDVDVDAVRIAVRVREVAGDGVRTAGVACGTDGDAYLFALALGPRAYEIWRWGADGLSRIAQGNAGARSGPRRAWTRLRAECVAQSDGGLALRFSVDGQTVRRLRGRAPVDLRSFALVASADAGSAELVFDDLVVSGA